jgi:hypothetical protein
MIAPTATDMIALSTPHPDDVLDLAVFLVILREMTSISFSKPVLNISRMTTRKLTAMMTASSTGGIFRTTDKPIARTPTAIWTLMLRWPWNANRMPRAA